MSLIFAVIVCVMFPVGFGAMSMIIIEKIVSIFGIDKYMSELYKKINILEDEVNRSI